MHVSDADVNERKLGREDLKIRVMIHQNAEENNEQRKRKEMARREKRSIIKNRQQKIEHGQDEDQCLSQSWPLLQRKTHTTTPQKQ